jgi:ribosomal protein S18 acetylase RimI-like enzyme
VDGVVGVQVRSGTLTPHPEPRVYPLTSPFQPLRPALPTDAPALAALKRDTFRETFLETGFAIPYPPDDLATFERAAYSLETVAAELSDPARATWVAEQHGRLVGYAQVGPCKLPHPDVSAEDGELYQLYIARDAQGLRLGAGLLDRALAHLAAHRPGPVWLGVWSGNAKAQAFYAAREFVRVGGYQFAVGKWLDDELILRRG